MEEDKDILKTARENKGYTQTEVADMLGIGLRMYQKIENGQFPKYKTRQIKNIDEILGTALYESIYEQNKIVHIEKGKTKSVRGVTENLPRKNPDVLSVIEKAILIIAESNQKLAEAFVKQAATQDKEAEARIIQATANKSLADTNKKMFEGLIINSGNHQHIALALEPYLQKLAHGLVGKSLTGENEIREEFDKLLFSYLEDGVKLGK